MNKRGHVLNAILLSVGLGVVLEPSLGWVTVERIAEVSVPVTLGALFPDVDTAFGRHRKTMHNLPLLGVVLAYPVVFGNLHWVWLGVVTHYILDVLGTQRGIALFYPLWDEEFGLPVGVGTSSPWSTPVTVGVTIFELVSVALLIYAIPSILSTSGVSVAGVP